MAAPKNNKFWLARSSHGRNPIFDNSEQLWESCLQYFEWVEDNPLTEERVSQFRGKFIRTEINKMRAMTIASLCIFLDVDQSTWENYRAKEDFFRVTKKVEQIIKTQKFTGAAANLLNANIIARDLGLADKQEVGGFDGKPLETINVEITDEDALSAYMNLIKKRKY